MQMIAVVRNVLIFAGIGVGGVLAIAGAIKSNEDANQNNEPVAAAPIVLNTAKPPDLGMTPFGKPVSLGSAFGRTELTGQAVLHVPANPLDELDFDRSWDVQLNLRAPKLPIDLPPDPASDEVSEPERDDTSLKKDPELSDLPAEARRHADEALVSLRNGTEALKEGMRQARMPGEEGVAGNRRIREAADMLRDSRDKLTLALEAAPNHPVLLRLMQETKANLYVCLKHGR
jgi:hypothetical protein